MVPAMTKLMENGKRLVREKEPRTLRTEVLEQLDKLELA
jgi:hypothetical protein